MKRIALFVPKRGNSVARTGFVANAVSTCSGIDEMAIDEYNPFTDRDRKIERLLESEGIPRIIGYIFHHYRKDFLEWLEEQMDKDIDFEKIRDLVAVKKNHKLTRFMRG